MKSLRSVAPVDYERYAQALSGEPLPAALVDLDAFEANAATVFRLVPEGKTLRVATKSVRCVELLDRIRARGGKRVRGVMTYSAKESSVLASHGEKDILMGYPTAQRSDADIFARLNREGATCSVIVDDKDQIEALAAAAREQRAVIPVVIEVDMAYRPFGLAHVGVRRSPLREPADVLALARTIRLTEGVHFHGLMGYEAQIAGLPDRDVFTRAMKARSRREVARRRSDIAKALVAEGFSIALFNGGGTGSLVSSGREEVLTEVTAGSGFLDGHLFDAYDDVRLAPALFFALQVVRRPAPGMVTCMGGGYVASGSAGKSRLPIPALPEGLTLLDLEGAGEVQTPLSGARGLALGDPVFFRHAKAGELAEHFNEYLLVRGSVVEQRAETYRGMGHSFLG